MATQKVTDVADAQMALKQRIAEIQEFLKMSAKEIESLDSRRETVVNEMNNAERDLRRATRAFDALNGDDEPKPMMNKAASESMMGLAESQLTAPSAPYYPEDKQ